MLTPNGDSPQARHAVRVEHSGEPQRLSPAWTLHKDDTRAECSVWSHWRGWELRLVNGSMLIRQQVVRSHEELVEVAMDWRDGMLRSGWHSA